jgi:hypothetical protein
MAVIKQKSDEDTNNKSLPSFYELLSKLKDVLTNPKFTLLVGGVAIVIDLILCVMVIRFVKCE